MHLRLTAVLVALVLTSVALAGCVNDDGGDGGDGGTPPGGTTPTIPTDGGGGGDAPPVDDPEPVTDSGAIQGAFEESWTLDVPTVSPRGAVVHFNLTGVQAGAPPTAVVHLDFQDPDGASLKRATIGLGQASNSVQWSFTPADLATTGAYTLVATAEESAGLPSGGAAQFSLYADVEY